jgi:hypothetical protein
MVSEKVSTKEGAKLRDYELVLVISPEVAEEKFEAEIDNVSQFITEKGAGERKSSSPPFLFDCLCNARLSIPWISLAPHRTRRSEGKASGSRNPWCLHHGNSASRATTWCKNNTMGTIPG